MNILDPIIYHTLFLFSRFSFGMGFSKHGGDSGIGHGVLAINVVGGICSCKSRWSELRLIFFFVVDVDWLLLGFL